MIGIKIRRFKKKDAEEVAKLITRNDVEFTSKFYPKRIIDKWVKEMSPNYILKKSDGGICYVAEKDKKLMGYINLGGNEIKKLFVIPDEHRKGIGSLLLTKIEELCKKRGIRTLILNSNISAQGFYISRGFTKKGEGFEEVDGGKFPIAKMEKKIKCSE